MYRLLIADDEALEREGLEWIVNRMLPNQFEIIHAENGRRAIEQAEERRPHIVLMDVQMPGIQGLEALREIRSMLQDVKLVLVTAYDSFAYAQEAITLGISEYIVKPASRDQMAKLLTRLVEELDREREKRGEQLELKSRMSTIQPLIENELALILMVDQAMGTSPETLAEWLDFRLDKQGRCLVIAFPGHDSSLDRGQLYETIRRLAKSQTSCIVSSILEHHLALFVHQPQAAEDGEEGLSRLAEKLAEAARALLHIAPSIGIGSLRNGAEGLRHSYFEAVFASTYPGREGQVCLFDDLKQGKQDAALADGVELSEERQRSYVLSALNRIRELREEQTATVMDRAIAYILERFTEELSLEDVAEYVHLNPFYFSKVFKQHVGENFIDYLTGLRIDKAKRLIEDKQLILKEVCYQVGYKDPNYFSRVFKKVTGVTPSEYRALPR
ncbi:two component transcriptional regulator, AraC family [Paenibacillus curdlanolyticus YK9]|uniref:Two component transcriptional regulator, AraC family n=1 Tax=Paenibacillus curdlanolyticus YK9 TaxID=717606 RepID=E0IA67_9BACL|nr:response regulator [Paenibacillus curdlanolyticus]EFM10644.1 two component transcriptional regulator, AraC family [Paenibacillus curdlanolyticus YK9]